MEHALSFDGSGNFTGWAVSAARAYAKAGRYRITDAATCPGCPTPLSTATRSRIFNIDCKEPLKDFAQRGACLDLRQRNILYAVNGCTSSPDDPANGTVNRPGTSTRFGSDQGSIPLIQLEQYPCNVHDVCYETCGESKDACDSEFRSDMDAVCAAAYAPPCPYDSAVTCATYSAERLECQIFANIYHLAVRTPVGRGAYRSGQVDYCGCCELPK